MTDNTRAALEALVDAVHNLIASSSPVNLPSSKPVMASLATGFEVARAAISYPPVRMMLVQDALTRAKLALNVSTDPDPHEGDGWCKLVMFGVESSGYMKGNIGIIEFHSPYVWRMVLRDEGGEWAFTSLVTDPARDINGWAHMTAAQKRDASIIHAKAHVDKILNMELP
ncbi:hypothetical protein [Rhizobium phage RHph_N46]|nr:hypothetical protein [Rhizobium phage RHph_N46]